jgi:hypothetical protein
MFFEIPPQNFFLDADLNQISQIDADIFFALRKINPLKNRENPRHPRHPRRKLLDTDLFFRRRFKQDYAD